MSRSRKVPSYRLHRQSGQAIVTLVDAASGQRKDVLLGVYGTAESRAEYARVIAEWEALARLLPKSAAANDLTVNELAAAFLDFSETHYRHPDGEPTGEQTNYIVAMRPLKELYGHTIAHQFGPLALKAVRAEMVKQKLSRGVVNSRIGRIKRMFKWAVSEQLIASSVYEALRTVSALSRGRSEARETEKVLPVPSERVDAILPYLTAPVRAMVELMRLTGMRPGEVCNMTRAQIDMSGPVWTYAPAKHKNAWRGQSRVIALGPLAQGIVKPFLKAELDAYLFSPKDAMQTRWQEQRENRKTKVYPCQTKRSRKKILCILKDRYKTDRIDLAIHRACDRAQVERFGANRLRHLHATAIRKRFGLEAASTSLGHHRIETTELYAEKNIEQAMQIAAQVG